MIEEYFLWVRGVLFVEYFSSCIRRQVQVLHILRNLLFTNINIQRRKWLSEYISEDCRLWGFVTQRINCKWLALFTDRIKNSCNVLASEIKAHFQVNVSVIIRLAITEMNYKPKFCMFCMHNWWHVVIAFDYHDLDFGNNWWMLWFNKWWWDFHIRLGGKYMSYAARLQTHSEFIDKLAIAFHHLRHLPVTFTW